MAKPINDNNKNSMESYLIKFAQNLSNMQNIRHNKESYYVSSIDTFSADDFNVSKICGEIYGPDTDILMYEGKIYGAAIPFSVARQAYEMTRCRWNQLMGYGANQNTVA